MDKGGKAVQEPPAQTEQRAARWRRLWGSPYFWLFLVISILFAVLFVRFWLGDYAYIYLDVGADTFDINYPLYCLFSRVLHGEGYNDYFLNVGLGMDMSSYLYQYLNPLNFLVVALPEHLIPWGILLASYGKLLLTGMFGYAFFYRVIRKVQPGESGSVLGSFAAALVWTFSGYMMLWGQHYGFAASIAMFTVFLYLVQRFVEEEEKSRNGILVLWITLMLFTNYYFLYMSGLMGALYVLVYLLFRKKNWKVIVRKLLELAGMGILGICIGGGCLVATWNVFRDSIRAGTVALDLSSAVKPYDLSWLLGFLARLFSNNAMGIGDGYTGPGNYYEIAMLCTSGLFFYGIFYLLLKKQTRRKTLCLTGIVLVLLALPFTGKIFTMNSGTQRWSFALCLLEALVIGIFLKCLRVERDRRKIRYTVTAGLIFGAISCGLLLWGQGQGYYDLYLKYLALAVGFLLIYGIFLLAWGSGKSRSGSVLLTLLCVELAVSNYPTLNFRENPTRSQVAVEYYNDGSREAAAASAAGETGPYRIAKTYQSASENDGMAQGYPGLSVYLTTNPRELIQLGNMYGGQGISINFADFNDGNDLRNGLLGMKYLLTQPGTMVSDAIWEELDSIGMKDCYRYRYALPFGYLYDRQWNREELQEMDETERVLASFLGFHFGGDPSETEYAQAEELFSTDEDISLLDHLTKVKDCGVIQDENGILIDEMTEDPYVIFSDVDAVLGTGPVHTVTVQAEVPEKTDLALYYKTEGDSDFSQDQICIFTLSPEDNIWMGTLPEDVTELRLDVSTEVDQVLLKELKINNCVDLNQAYEKLQSSPVTGITWEANTYQAQVDNVTDQSQMLCVPFLYSKGWQASIDGEMTTVYNINSGLTGIEIPKGGHVVTLTYESPDKLAGRILTLSGILIYVALFGGDRLRKRYGKGKRRQI